MLSGAICNKEIWRVTFFLGSLLLKHMLKIFRVGDIYIHTARIEPFWFSILEAWQLVFL